MLSPALEASLDLVALEPIDNVLASISDEREHCQGGDTHQDQDTDNNGFECKNSAIEHDTTNMS